MNKITIYDALNAQVISTYDNVKGETIYISSVDHIKFKDCFGKAVDIIGSFIAIIQEV